MHNKWFEWDDIKAELNFRKHGVRFEWAIDIFKDVFAIDFIDDRHDYAEERCIIIGMCHSRLLYVSYTMRGETIRLISARAAGPFEQRRYYEFNA